MEIFGEVKIFKNGELVLERNNAIGLDLKDYFVSEMNTPADKAVNDLFTVQGHAHTDASGGLDGIVIRMDDNSSLTMITTQESTTTYSVKWKGEFTNNDAADVTPIQYVIGHNYNGPYDFEVVYAILSLAAAQQITLQQSDSVVVEWTINVTT